jgi:hypothetical protein
VAGHADPTIMRTYVPLMDDGLGRGGVTVTEPVSSPYKQGCAFHPAGVMLEARRGESMSLEKYSCWVPP